MKKIDERKLNIHLNKLDLVSQTFKSLEKFQIKTVSDFLFYDCSENTKYSSYGIIPLKIGKNARKRLYRELSEFKIPRAFEKNTEAERADLKTSVFDLPISVGTINKLYRCRLTTLEETLALSTFERMCLGENYDELKEFVEQQGLTIKHVPISDQILVDDLLLPKRMNVIKNDKIIKNHADWMQELPSLIAKLKINGVETIGDLKNCDYDNLLENYGEELIKQLAEIDIDVTPQQPNEELRELKKMRSMIEMLLEIDEYSPLQKQDIVSFAKKIIK